MQRRIVGWLAWVGVLTATACAPAPIERPKLVVLIGIDQFRADYLERYDAALTGGFRRLKDHGRYYPGATVEHAPTLSYPGHTTLATGSHPKTHGITSNAWVETLADGRKRRVSAARDPSVEILGEPDSPGLSPRQIRVTGLADWIRDAHRDAHAVALSTGPALAMLYGGKALEHEARNHAYWLSGSSGRFVTSSYHRTTYPDWVQRFNDRRADWHGATWRAMRAMGCTRRFRIGSSLMPRRTIAPGRDTRGRRIQALSTRGSSTALSPMRRCSPLPRRQSWRCSSARTVQRISSPSQSNQWTGSAMTMDRGVRSSLISLCVSTGCWPGSWTSSTKLWAKTTTSSPCPPTTVHRTSSSMSSNNVRITEELIRELVDHVDRLVTAYDGPAEQLASRIARELEQFDIVARAMTPDELAGTEPADDILRYYRNSYVLGRSTPFPLWTRTHPANFGIVVEYVEQGQLWTARSAHGTSYLYDREVPILLMGPGVPAGRVTETARTIDVAPTLAHLAGIPYAETVDGRVLQVSKRDR